MKTQFIQMTKGGVKAYFAAMKQQRKEAAEFYRDNPEFTMGQVGDRFKLSPVTMKKALDENGIEVDRDRQYRSRKGKRLTCPECKRVVFHDCGAKEAVARAEAKMLERIDPRRIHPVTGRIVERTPEYIAYVEGSMPWEPPAEPGKEHSLEDNYLPGDTPEMKEYAVLGLEGIMDRVRAGLGIK